MRLATFAGRIHALDGPLGDPATRAVDLGAATGLPADPAAFLAAEGLAVAADLDPHSVETVAVAGLASDPVVPHPRMIWAVGLNYRAHAAEVDRPLPTVPAMFAKSPGALLGHGAPIVIPPHVQRPDYEGEVAVVIGRTARDVEVRTALDHVAGVTAAHDVSARDHQYVTGQFSWSKSFDTFCPLGPELVTREAAGDLEHLRLETRLNGEVVQSSTTADLVFSISELVAWISQGLTLVPGDVILTGTPAGVGAARTPPRWLEDGDVVEITVGGVTTLRNPVVRRL